MAKKRIWKGTKSALTQFRNSKRGKGIITLVITLCIIAAGFTTGKVYTGDSFTIKTILGLIGLIASYLTMATLITAFVIIEKRARLLHEHKVEQRKSLTKRLSYSDLP
jgi:uncharacterized membrane protein